MPQPNYKPVRETSLANGLEVSLREISEHLGLSKETTREIEVSALRKFKREIEKRGYKMEDFLT
jgi:DNA-directed RNA polymerase sigma subunit (sigma70/sigma32)